MAGRETMKAACKKVRPLMSTDFCEARRRALGLYRAFYRYIPYIRPASELKSKSSASYISQTLRSSDRLFDLFSVLHLKFKYFDIPKSENDCRRKLREYFYKNACITDIRIIDMLVMKGYMELKEITHQWQQKGHLMAHWKPTYEPKPYDFIGKFLSGVD